MHESAVPKGIACTILSVFMGWRGLPWGLLYTMESSVVNTQGGRDVTRELIEKVMPAGDSGAVLPGDSVRD